MPPPPLFWFALPLALAFLVGEAVTPRDWPGVFLTAATADDDDDDDDDDDRPRYRAPRPFFVPPQGSAPRRRAASPTPDAIGREIVLYGVTPAEVAQLQAERFAVLADRPRLSGGDRVVRLRPPGRMSVAQALRRAREIAPRAAVDRNHLYRHGYRAQAGRGGRLRPFNQPFQAVAWPTDPGRCSPPVRIGLIDTGVDPAHTALYGRTLIRETVRGPGLAPSSTLHGTAVATLILGDGRSPGLLPTAELVAVDAFHRRGGGESADTFDLISAVDLLLARGVRVINLSLAGPPNEALDRAGRAARERGVTIVAAAGNEGPAAPPLYPAAYDWAVAVTALDEARAPYERASRGAHLDLSAPGVGLEMLDARGRTRLFSGTSFAAPFVTAALAMGSSGGGDAVLTRMTGKAADLGAPGRDDVFGWGLLQAGDLCGQESGRVGNK